MWGLLHLPLFTPLVDIWLCLGHLEADIKGKAVLEPEIPKYGDISSAYHDRSPKSLPLPVDLFIEPSLMRYL